MSPTTIPGNLILKNGTVEADPYYNNVSLLLHGDGTNGSTTIVDSSPSPKTVTAFGDTQISTAQSKFGGSSIAFDGSGDYFEIASDASLALGATFTIEMWYYLNTTASRHTFISQAFTEAFNGAGSISIYTEGATYPAQLRVSFGGSLTIGSISVAATTWTHLAVVCDNGTLSVFMDGQYAAGPTYDARHTHSTQPLFSGRLSQYAGYDTNGYIDDLRITKGVARYTSTFTPPTAPFPEVLG